MPAGRQPLHWRRRRLRSRIVWSFFLLGFGLTLLLAFSSSWVRGRVEDDLIVDMMNRNIQEFEYQYRLNPQEYRHPDLQPLPDGDHGLWTAPARDGYQYLEN